MSTKELYKTISKEKISEILKHTKPDDLYNDLKKYLKQFSSVELYKYKKKLENEKSSTSKLQINIINELRDIITWNLSKKYLSNDIVNLYDYHDNYYDEEKGSYEIDCRDDDVESFIEHFM